MDYFSDRLKKERKRLGETQESFAKLGGVSRSAQIKYERLEATPSITYMENLAKNGVDIGYVITGKRTSTESTSEEYLSDGQAEKIYTKPEDALSAALDVQNRYGLSFSADQLKALIGFAWHYQATEDDLAEFVKYAYGVAGVELPGKE